MTARAVRVHRARLLAALPDDMRPQVAAYLDAVAEQLSGEAKVDSAPLADDFSASGAYPPVSVPAPILAAPPVAAVPPPADAYHEPLAFDADEPRNPDASPVAAPEMPPRKYIQLPIELLIRALPRWCKKRGIQANYFRGFRDRVSVWDEIRSEAVDRPVLDWDEQNMLVGLRLDGQMIGTPLPTDLTRLVFLRHLHITQAQLQGPLPAEIGKLVQLKSLDLRNNQLTQLPDSIEKLTNLTRIRLGGNRLTQLPEVLCNMTQLVVLNLNSNEITALPERMGDLTNLAVLGLAYNKIERLPPSMAEIHPTKLELFGNPTPAQELLSQIG
ncbi:hypothetical protein HK105_206266 [Polyrhizophydium stewartii]|uniref:Disease resistance R13L4/SHOC-2-like LRR domain-containing protein n=1 Tax=Polyrhizophydium stewartii TaxID=2732419 RepID=A0ABR4N3R6_9FUNG